MGGLFGGALQAGGNDVTLVDVARDTVETINRDGLRIDDKQGNSRVISIRATTQPAEAGVADLLINFVKCYHTESAINAARPMIGDGTIVLTLQNGWGNADTISRLVGKERVVVGLTYHSATLVSPGRVMHSGTGITHVGEIGGGESDRVARIVAMLNAITFEARVSPDILTEIWNKLALNAATLPVSAALGFLAHQLVEHEGSMAEMRAVLEEVVSVAKAQNIPLDLDERWSTITGLLARAVGGKGSMLQDVLAKRRTEIDVINGAIVAAGERVGIPTPHNRAMVNMIRAAESAYAPKAVA